MKTIHLITLILLVAILNQCKQEELIITELTSDVTIKSQFDNYFDWDQLNTFPIRNPNLGRIDYVEIPWATGSTSSMGIPSNWLDENAYDSNYENRYYHRKNHWVLVYSNLTTNNMNKYFTLYNTYTGILRFFFYALSNASSGGNTSSFWGIRIDKNSSLFNFTKPFSTGIDSRINTPIYISTPPGILMGDKLLGTGYQVNNWYGIEVECAFDPTVTSGSSFEIVGWAANVSKITGVANTDGSIKGTITSTSSGTGLSINLSNMFNTNNQQTITADHESASDAVGNNLEKKVNSNDPFSKSLWNNIKSTALRGLQLGVKEGVKAIFSSGGSLAASAIGKLAGSVLGKSDDNTSVSKVDLKLTSKTTFQLESEQLLPGYGTINKLPLPGSTTNPNNMPLYIKPLGVWNLRRTPIVTIEGLAHNFADGTGVYSFKYATDCNINDIILNDEIKNKVSIRNFSVKLACDENNNYIFRNLSGESLPLRRLSPYATVNNVNFYSQGTLGSNSIHGGAFRTYGSSWYDGEAHRINHGNFKVQVSFDLTDNSTGEIYTFVRWFETKFGSHKTNFKSIRITGGDYSLTYDKYANDIASGYFYPTGYVPYGYYADQDFTRVFN